MSVDASETNTGTTENGTDPDGGGQLSLSTAAARNLATTTKTPPQMQGITSRWLLKVLPWTEVSGGTYRVNRRLTHAVGGGKIGFAKTGDDVRVVAPTLAELPPLHGFDDAAVLDELAGRFAKREFNAGQVIGEAGQPVDRIVLIAHGKVERAGKGKYGGHADHGALADGDHVGVEALTDPAKPRAFTLKAATKVTAMVLSAADFQAFVDRSPALRDQLERSREKAGKASNHKGEADIALASGHEGEADLPGTFVDYQLTPREYELSVAQTVLRIHSRVADLYNQPMNQLDQQLRLTVEALRERQEHELVNNPDFGLLHNADFDQRVQTHSGPPTPDDLDELLSRRRDTQYLLAHPRAIAAFGRECTKRGVYPGTMDFGGSAVPSWRGVPMLPCAKIPVVDGHTSSILALRTGQDNQGVVGLHQTGLPDEYQPGLSVRFMGINEKAVVSYLVSAYYSAAVLVPDALGVLENVEIARGRG